MELPKGKRIVGRKWVYKKKDGDKFKARLVVKGYSQKKGVDYDKIFSPMIRHSSIRCVLSLCSTLGHVVGADGCEDCIFS